MGRSWLMTLARIDARISKGSVSKVGTRRHGTSVFDGWWMEDESKAGNGLLYRHPDPSALAELAAYLSAWNIS